MSSGGQVMAGAPAGWYDDPEDATRLRRWDGVGWTDSWMARGPGATTSPGTQRALLPGWHPDPADANRHRWWDGVGWSARVVDGMVFRERDRLGTGFRVLGYSLVALFALHLVVGLLVAGFDVWFRAILGRWASDPESVTLEELDLAESVASVASVVGVGAMLLTGVLFVVWLYRVHGSDRVDPSALRYGRGWTVGGWFTPVLSLFRPYEVVRDVWRGLGERVGGSPGPWVVLAWWVAFLLGRMGAFVVTLLERDLEARPVSDQQEAIALLLDLRTMASWEAATMVLSAGAAVLAAVVVLRVDRAVHAGEHDDPLPAAAPAA